MAQMGFFDLSDRYTKRDSLVEANAVVQWEGSGQHWSGSGSIFRDAQQNIAALLTRLLAAIGVGDFAWQVLWREATASISLELY